MAGAIAERMTLMAYLGYTCLMTAWVSQGSRGLKGPQQHCASGNSTNHTSPWAAQPGLILN